MATYPTVVLVPGSFTHSSDYDVIVLPLREKGYSVHALDAPCYPKGYKKNTPAPNMLEDAKFINEYVTKLADEGQEVVMLAHSYGGTPTTESLKGITKREREQAGKKGGVVRIAYITSVVPKVGQTVAEVITPIDGQGGVPGITMDEFGWMTHGQPELSAQFVFNGLPAERRLEEAKKFGHHAGPSFATPLTHNGYKDVPVSWFFCEDDKCILPQVQHMAIDDIEESWKGTDREGKKVDVKRVNCDHCPIFTAPDVLHDWIESAIKKGGQE